MALFDKVSGSYTSSTATSITDSSANWTTNQFKDWYVVINKTEYRIESNTNDTLTFQNSVVSTGNYEIYFVGRKYLEQIESDASDSVKIKEDLINKKYDQTNIDVDNKVFSYLRNLYSSYFDPLVNILNLEKIQRPYAYYMLYLIYTDLCMMRESFDTFKIELYFDMFKSTIKDSLNLLQIDFNEDGEANWNEKRNSASTINFLTR